MRFFATFLMMTYVLPAQAEELVKQHSTGRILDLKYNFKEAGREMSFSLYLPKAYTNKKKWPLVVALHGLFSNPWQMIRYPGITAQAEKYGFIVVAPMGYNSMGWYGSRGQKSNLSLPKNLGELSEKDVLNVVANTQKEFSVDAHNIFLMGHSMGGGGTWHLGMKYPEKWAVLAPLAPAAPNNIDALKKIKGKPVIMVMGTSDFLWQSGLSWVAEMKKLNMNYKYIEVKEGGHLLPVIQKLPDVFAFFEKHRRKPLKKP